MKKIIHCVLFTECNGGQDKLFQDRRLVTIHAKIRTDKRLWGRLYFIEQKLKMSLKGNVLLSTSIKRMDNV